MQFVFNGDCVPTLSPTLVYATKYCAERQFFHIRWVLAYTTCCGNETQRDDTPSFPYKEKSNNKYVCETGV